MQIKKIYENGLNILIFFILVFFLQCSDPEIISNLMLLPHLKKADHDIVSFSMRLQTTFLLKVQPDRKVRV